MRSDAGIALQGQITQVPNQPASTFVDRAAATVAVLALAAAVPDYSCDCDLAAVVSIATGRICFFLQGGLWSAKKQYKEYT